MSNQLAALGYNYCILFVFIRNPKLLKILLILKHFYHILLPI